MNSKHPLAHGLLALSLGAAVPPALAGDDCEVPLNRWQSRDAVLQRAAGKGWDVRRLKIDDGCYEVLGKDAQGRTFKAKLDPQTLEVVKMKLRDAERTRRARGGRVGQPDQPRTDALPGSPQPGFVPGTAPRGQVE